MFGSPVAGGTRQQATASGKKEKIDTSLSLRSLMRLMHFVVCCLLLPSLHKLLLDLPSVCQRLARLLFHALDDIPPPSLLACTSASQQGVRRDASPVRGTTRKEKKKEEGEGGKMCLAAHMMSELKKRR